MDGFIFSLIIGIFIGGVCGYLGTLMLSRKMALTAGPLGHLTLPGIALSLIYGFDVSLGAFPFVILGIFLIWLFETRTKLPMETLTAVVFASGVAIAFLFLPVEQAETALIGDITRVDIYGTIITSILCFLIFLIIRKNYHKMVLINISEDLAKASGINVRKNNLLYLFLIGILVSLGVRMVGGLLTAALFAIPAASSRNFSKNLFQYTNLSIFFGILSSLLGILIYKFTNLPAGPLIISVSSLIFLISVIFKR